MQRAELSGGALRNIVLSHKNIQGSIDKKANSMKKEIKIMLVGMGTVGGSFLKILVSKKSWLEEQNLKVKVLATVSKEFITLAGKGEAVHVDALLSPKKYPKNNAENKVLPYCEQRLYETLAGGLSEDIDIIVEATPTLLGQKESPALKLFRYALAEGVSVVTANKAPIAEHYAELHALALKHKASLRFESTVLSGTPLFNMAQAAMNGLEFHKIEGVLNGTCNYILSRMEEGLEYSAALKQAQTLGYAESNPIADVGGSDSLLKAVILANFFMKASLQPDTSLLCGIQGVTQERIKEAKAKNCVLKLIASIERNSALDSPKISLGIKEIAGDHPLFSVRDAYNGIVFHAPLIDTISIFGKGAGGDTAAFGLFSDMLLVAKKF